MAIALAPHGFDVVYIYLGLVNQNTKITLKGVFTMIYQGGIKQIMPAPENLYVRNYDEIEGDFYTPIVGIALCEDGEVRFLDTVSDGEITCIDEDYGNRLCKYNDEKQEYMEV